MPLLALALPASFSRATQIPLLGAELITIAVISLPFFFTADISHN
jgi:hypothetical protein